MSTHMSIRSDVRDPSITQFCVIEHVSMRMSMRMSIHMSTQGRPANIPVHLQWFCVNVHSFKPADAVMEYLWQIVCVDMCIHVRTDMCIGTLHVCVDTYVQCEQRGNHGTTGRSMCIDLCTGMYTDMCVDIRTHMCIDMCIDM